MFSSKMAKSHRIFQFQDSVQYQRNWVILEENAYGRICNIQ